MGRSKLLNESDHTDELRCLIKVDRATLVAGSKIVLTTGLGNYPGLFSGNMLALHAAKKFLQSRPTMRGRRLQQYFIKLQLPTRLTKIVCIAKLPKQGSKVIHIASAHPSGGGALPFFETWISALISSALRPIYRKGIIILETCLCFGGSSSP